MHTERHPAGFLAYPGLGHPGVVVIPDVWGLSQIH
jgi:hypothetical protein